MAQSRNPSERNKVGEKQKKKQAWWESALDVAGDLAVGLGKTAASNFNKVGEFGGNLVKGVAVDPLVWAAQNPAEVGKTFVNPNRASEWIYDNLFAGNELDRVATGKGGLTDAAIAAMALFPIGRVADDAVRAALSSGAREVVAPAAEEVAQAAASVVKSGSKKIKPSKPSKYGYKLDRTGNVVAATADDVAFNPEVILKSYTDDPAARAAAAAARRDETIAAMRDIMPETMAKWESGPNNFYTALDSVIYRMGKRGEEIAQARRGGLVNAETGVINRTAESPIENIGATRAAEINAGGPTADNYALQRVPKPTGEADSLLEAIAQDKQVLARGSDELSSLISGLAKMEMNAATMMPRAKAVEEELLKMIKAAETPQEKAMLRQLGKRWRTDVMEPMELEAVSKRTKRAEPKRSKVGYESQKGK